MTEIRKIEGRTFTVHRRVPKLAESEKKCIWYWDCEPGYICNAYGECVKEEVE